MTAAAHKPRPRRRTGRAFVGLSGWSYPAWRAGFYKGVPQRRWLAHCAAHFGAVEVNATFYRRLREAIYVRWREETPPGFVFAVKGHRQVTHLHKLSDAADPVARQRTDTAALGDRLAAVLWQTPASLHKDMDRLGAFAEILDGWPQPRHAIEFRHTSWFDDEVAACLAGHGLAVCISDAGTWPMWDRVTTDLVYVRLHGHEVTYASSYNDAQLGAWAARSRGWTAEGRDVHVYFDNDMEGAAPYDALRLIDTLGAGGAAAAA